ncbi:MAG: hypothetical protein JWP57_1494 [Spirosoma sp.]|nr:hypothetical protein [Spirosoma sp.]
MGPISHFLLMGLIMPFATRKRPDQSGCIKGIDQRPDVRFNILHGRIVQGWTAGFSQLLYHSQPTYPVATNANSADTPKEAVKPAWPTR